MWDEIADEAAAESPLWAEALLPSEDQRRAGLLRSRPVRAGDRARDDLRGLSPPLRPASATSPPDADVALLLGDYLYAHGLVRVARSGDVDAVADLAELISLCAQARADGRDGDGARGRRRPRFSVGARSTRHGATSVCAAMPERSSALPGAQSATRRSTRRSQRMPGSSARVALR